MKDFQLVRYSGDEHTATGMLALWCLGWFDLLRGVIRVGSFGTLDTDAKLWFLVHTDPTKSR